MRLMVGVCGSVAAYKAVELVRLLQQRGAAVEVTMTDAAGRFVTPLTFASITGRTVFTSLWQPAGAAESDTATAFSIEHIEAIRSIDTLVIAPATANTIAKLAHGIADDFLTCAYLACKAPVILAPAMNVNMWNHPATQANLQALAARGVHIVHPEGGYLACGMVGDGRLASIESIADRVQTVLSKRHDLEGETVLITAGGTREPLDPVRFIGNRSSGRMGHALAFAAHARGANVILVTASSLPAPDGCQVVRVNTAGEMCDAVMKHLAESTLVIGAAAVSDYRPRNISPVKLRRHAPLTLELEPTEDIMAKAAQERADGTILIGFAAELEDVEENARAKLLRKGVDAIVVNDVSDSSIGFDSEENAGAFITGDNIVPLPKSSKREMADLILNQVLDQVARVRSNSPASRKHSANASHEALHSSNVQ